MFEGREIVGGISREDWINGNLVIHLAARVGQRQFMAFSSLDAYDRGELLEEGAEPPGIQLSRDIAEALLRILSRHFGGAASDAAQLRKDYDAERARVDKLIDFAITPPTVEYRTEVR